MRNQKKLVVQQSNLKNRRGKRNHKAETSGSLSLSELSDMHKDDSHQPGELIISWLLQCWDTGTNSQELEGKEAQQLGSLTKGLEHQQRAWKRGSHWRQFLSSMKKRYLLREDLVNYWGKWKTTESIIQYLRELAVVEDLQQWGIKRPGWVPVHGVHGAEVCMKHTNNVCLALRSRTDTEAPMVGKLASQLKQVEENLTSIPTL